MSRFKDEVGLEICGCSWHIVESSMFSISNGPGKVLPDMKGVSELGSLHDAYSAQAGSDCCCEALWPAGTSHC